MLDNELDNILNNSDKSLIEIYRTTEIYFEELYGKNILILMEVGSFYEMYCPTINDRYHHKLKYVCDLINIQMTRKNNRVLEDVSFKNPAFAGFNAVSLDKFLPILVNDKTYTIILIGQKKVGSVVKRYFDKVISPGTNIDYTKEEENYVFSLNIELLNELYICGFSMVDVNTGKTFFNEFYSTKEDKLSSLDQTYMVLQRYNISEIVLKISNNIDLEFIKQYLEISDFIHLKVTNTSVKIVNQNALFKKAFAIKSYLEPIEYFNIYQMPLLSESLALLIDFIYEHNTNLIEHLVLPKFLNDNHYMYLGNEPIKQLEIYNKTQDNFNLLNVLNTCKTTFGKRAFKERLLNPIIDKIELERRYTEIENCMSIYQNLIPLLDEISDLEKINRKIVLKTFSPFEINSLYSSFKNIESINTVKSIMSNEESLKITEFLNYLEKIFDMNQTSRFNLKNINENIFNKGVSLTIDKLLDEELKYKNVLNQIVADINSLVNSSNINIKSSSDIISLEYNDRDGYYLSITKNRHNTLKDFFEKNFITINGEHIFLKDFSVSTQISVVKMSHKKLKEISENLIIISEKIKAQVIFEFEKQLEHIKETYFDFINIIIPLVAELDISVSQAENAKKYKFCKPIIQNYKNNFIEAINMRHTVIERNDLNGIFTPNDIFIGESKLFKHSDKLYSNENDKLTKENINGFLLFGLNSAGKSTQMKQVGQAIIMAQAGLFVPSEYFAYTIFDSLFTRIIGNDNASRGLSSFAVEMIELNNILTRMTPKSLVLGDEICKGTEYYSALSIVATSLNRINAIGSSYIFATHLHELIELDEINNIKELVFLNMKVEYNKETSSLHYNRKLCLGHGESNYGLEFTKTIIQDKSFISDSIKIREKLLNKKKELNNKYNKNLAETDCAICKYLGVSKSYDDIHHISFQSKADDNGLINHFHKNSLWNLLPLCKEHHNLLHKNEHLLNQGSIEYVKTSNGTELKLDDTVKKLIY